MGHLSLCPRNLPLVIGIVFLHRPFLQLKKLEHHRFSSEIVIFPFKYSILEPLCRSTHHSYWATKKLYQGTYATACQCRKCSVEYVRQCFLFFSWLCSRTVKTFIFKKLKCIPWVALPPIATNQFHRMIELVNLVRNAALTMKKKPGKSQTFDRKAIGHFDEFFPRFYAETQGGNSWSQSVGICARVIANRSKSSLVCCTHKVFCCTRNLSVWFRRYSPKRITRKPGNITERLLLWFGKKLSMST